MIENQPRNPVEEARSRRPLPCVSPADRERRYSPEFRVSYRLRLARLCGVLWSSDLVSGHLVGSESEWNPCRWRRRHVFGQCRLTRRRNGHQFAAVAACGHSAPPDRSCPTTMGRRQFAGEAGGICRNRRRPLSLLPIQCKYGHCAADRLCRLANTAANALPCLSLDRRSFLARRARVSGHFAGQPAEVLRTCGTSPRFPSSNRKE